MKRQQILGTVQCGKSRLVRKSLILWYSQLLSSQYYPGFSVWWFPFGFVCVCVCVCVLTSTPFKMLKEPNLKTGPRWSRNLRLKTFYSARNFWPMNNGFRPLFTISRWNAYRFLILLDMLDMHVKSMSDSVWERKVLRFIESPICRTLDFLLLNLLRILLTTLWSRYDSHFSNKESLT